MGVSEPHVFIVAGMPRTATTFLYQRFQDHPSIFCPYRKETNFFSVNYHKGAHWYSNLYAEMAAGQVGADVSPAYFLDEAVIDRIHAFDPQIRIILGIRPASEWALSWYQQVLSAHTGAKPSLQAFLTGYDFEISGGRIWQDFRSGFVSRMIERYRQAFGATLLLYHYRAFRDDPLAVVNSIEEFVGVPRHFSGDNLRNEIVNAGTRRNIGIVAKLLSREQFVEAVGRLAPRRLVRAARNAYVALGTSKAAPPKASFSPEELALADGIFADDDRWIEALFAGAAIQLGTGATYRPLAPASSNAGAGPSKT